MKRNIFVYLKEEMPDIDWKQIEDYFNKNNMSVVRDYQTHKALEENARKYEKLYQHAFLATKRLYQHIVYDYPDNEKNMIDMAEKVLNITPEIRERNDKIANRKITKSTL